MKRMTIKTQTELSKVNTELTIIKAIERIVEAAIDSHLSDEFYNETDVYLQYLSERMNLTKNQALLFALFIEKSSCYSISVSDFAKMVDCMVVSMISIMSETDVLEKRGLIRRRRVPDGDVSYCVPVEVVAAVQSNKAYELKPIVSLTLESFYDNLYKIFENESFETVIDIENTLDNIICNNQQLQICSTIKQLSLPRDKSYALFLVCVFIHYFINKNDDNIGVYDWEDYFEKKYYVRSIISEIRDKSHILVEKKIIELCNDDGVSDNGCYHLTDSIKEQLFPDLKIVRKDMFKSRLIPYSSFAEKHLYYNSNVQSQINQLAMLLQPEYFKQVQTRLVENGMRKGFACLFYGAPGTGKTETVNQLARMTGRDVMIIDVSEIKSCWVGESEKNIKAVFDRYRRCAENAKVTPILLFNEADAVLGIRREEATRSVDKMENSIQNIILQEMEQLDGIMIATTNLTQNLDKAFERRFIYKIEFERPSVDARTLIWQSMIPELDSATAAELAQQFDFSGGQIENIARKRTVDLILRGTEPTVEQLADYCRTEILTSHTSVSRRVGF